MMLWCYPHQLNPSIVAKRKVKGYMFFSLSAVIILSITIINFPYSLQDFGKNVNMVQQILGYLQTNEMIVVLLQIGKYVERVTDVGDEAPLGVLGLHDGHHTSGMSF